MHVAGTPECCFERKLPRGLGTPLETAIVVEHVAFVARSLLVID